MIDRQLLNYPEQLAVRLSQMEKDITTLKKGGLKVTGSGGGGGGVVVVQTTGTSTTNVMSQNAVTQQLNSKVSYSELPEKLPNPFKLIIGDDEYDGSEEVTITPTPGPQGPKGDKGDMRHYIQEPCRAKTC